MRKKLGEEERLPRQTQTLEEEVKDHPYEVAVALLARDAEKRLALVFH